jgi:spermidine/putrescine transport system permease protein
MQLGKTGNRPLAVYAVLYLVFLYVPVLFLPVFSFNDSLYISFPLKGFTLQWYREMMHNDALLRSLMNSIKVALATSMISTLLGIFAAKAVTRYRMPGKKPVVATIMLSLVIPEIILGTALLMSRFEGFDRSMEEASADLGENAWWTFWRVTVPMAMPGITASFLLCFTISFDEFIMAFFLGSTDPTLPVFMWNQLRFPQKLPGVLALGSCILLMSFGVIALAERLRRRNSFNPDSGVITID